MNTLLKCFCIFRIFFSPEFYYLSKNGLSRILRSVFVESWSFGLCRILISWSLELLVLALNRIHGFWSKLNPVLLVLELKIPGLLIGLCRILGSCCKQNPVILVLEESWDLVLVESQALVLCQILGCCSLYNPGLLVFIESLILPLIRILGSWFLLNPGLLVLVEFWALFFLEESLGLGLILERTLVYLRKYLQLKANFYFQVQ